MMVRSSQSYIIIFTVDRRFDDEGRRGRQTVANLFDLSTAVVRSADTRTASMQSKPIVCKFIPLHRARDDVYATWTL